MKKSEIPVEGLYILAFLVLISLAGTSLYFYLEGQSTARDYRISVGKILEESESIKILIDQERQFVLETVVFFLGSQGGVANIGEYNEYDLTKIGSSGVAYDCIEAMKNLNNGIYPSSEVLSKCLTSKNYFKYTDGLGAWKCDNYLYSYEYCDFSTQSLCCLAGNKICHEGCLHALGYDLNQCYDKRYCGALWCKENNLEIPETYQGVQYYSKISNKMPGYFCDSIISYDAEKNYNSLVWDGIDSTTIINNLIKLSNEYFYMPFPKFSEYLKDIYKKDLKLTFQLNFKGCNNELCEFSWVPYENSNQKFSVKGLNGIPIVELSNEILSLQSLKVPIFDMIKISKDFVQNQEIKSTFSNLLKDNVFLQKNVNFDKIKYPAEWKNDFSSNLGINENNRINGTDSSVKKYDIYDNSICGDYPFNNTEYDCMMQHVSTKIYNTISNPMVIEKPGINYYLRPVFNFVKTSLGANIKISEKPFCGNSNCEYGETTSNCITDCPIKTVSYLIYSEDYSCGEADALKSTIQSTTYFTSPYNEGVNTNNNIISHLLSDLEEKRCLTDLDFLDEISFSVNLDSGKYSMFLKGEGNLTVNLNIINAGENNQFNININSKQNSGDEYYEQVKKISDEYGRCAYNYYNKSNIKNLIFYENMGCCKIEDYSVSGGYCKNDVLKNNYCESVNSKNGRSQTGAYCLIDNSLGGDIDYNENLININAGEVTFEISNYKGLIKEIDFIRMDYDNTYPIKTVSSNGISRTIGGSLEYYSNTEDCTSAMGTTAITYDSMDDNELWYSMLCLRVQGKNWVNIIENYTAMYSKFKQVFSSNPNNIKNEIDNFIKTYDFDKTYDTTAKKLYVTFKPCTTNNCGIMNLEGGKIAYEYSTPFISYAIDDSILQRLIEIQTQTSYLPLPIKWIFAYNDKVTLDQSNINTDYDANCNLNYNYEKTWMPDCGCKLNCQENYQCVFDFNDLPIDNLFDQLYHFKAIFIDNQDYKTNGVVGE